MPSRFAFFATADDIKSKFPISEVNIDLYPYYNLKPTNRATGIINDDGYKLVRLRWGYVKGNQFFKARAESVHEKRLFSKGFRERRCVILANGFFEWNKEDKKSIPFYFKLKSDELMLLAGVFNSHVDKEDGETKYQFAVITTGSNGVVGQIFHRMPAILTNSELETWLNYDINLDDVRGLLRPYDDDQMESYQVNPLPSRGDNGPDTIKPVSENSGLDDFF